MSASVNKVFIMGNLTRDPELRYLPTGAAVCELNIALNSSYTSKQTGQKVEEVTFVEVVAWGKTAENAAEYLKKGRAVFVEGALKQDRWEDDKGNKRSKTKVTAHSIQFIGGKKEGAAAPAGTSAEDEIEPPF